MQTDAWMSKKRLEGEQEDEEEEEDKYYNSI